MKPSLKLTALLLLASAGVFAATPAKNVKAEGPEVTISSLAANNGVAVSAADKSVVIIYDQFKNVLRKDVLAGNTSKGYILNKLENGDYTMEVTANKQTVKKDIHVYEEGKTKTFLIKQ